MWAVHGCGLGKMVLFRIRADVSTLCSCLHAIRIENSINWFV